MPDPIRSGAVEWTGDNPFIYLKEDPERDWSALSLFFRITASQHGVGHAMLVLEDPNGVDDRATRRLLTDNLPLAEYLLGSFVKRFVLFRPFQGWEQLEVVEDARFSTDAGDRNWLEHATSADGSLTAAMRWSGLGTPTAVDLAPTMSATGEHEMFSVFRTAESASVEIDGRALAGHTIERDFLNSRSQSAALALSETWVNP